MKSQQIRFTNEVFPSIIPQPVKMKFNSGNFIINDRTIIQTDLELKKISEYLKELITPPTGFDPQIEIGISEQPRSDTIVLNLQNQMNLGSEGYHLVINQDSIYISAPTPAGVFYGVQTLRQLLPNEIEKRKFVEDFEWVIPCVKIEDYPRFSWRGFMLDEGRHFQGKKIVKRLLDIIALHKMNTFHWHLTEDQGWRIEIETYPQLVKVGSIREGTQIGGMRSFLRKKKKLNPTPHSGCYTQEEIKEIVSYANDRYIKVIPEIDMPGHSMAALAAYPKLSCTGGPFKVQTTFGIKKDVLCPGKEEVFTFLYDILNELIELFPSKIIHIGGDEVPKSRWKECPACQQRIIKEGLRDEKDLETYFINRIASYLIDKGIKPTCWNDVLDERLVPGVIVQHWLRGDDKVLEHLRKGRQFVISRFFYTYLDYPYTMTPLRKSYSFEPVPDKLEEEYHSNILGLEAPMWTEWAPTIDRLDWQIFPRLTAHAETGWTLKENKDYNSFKKRLERFIKRLNILGIKAARFEKTDPNFIKRFFYPLDMLRDPQKNVTK
ncbi:MAG: beta-N-acetylhexosaminidase [Candidatus Thorarchaeota archaeon]